MEYRVENGIYKLDFELSRLEKEILEECMIILENTGFKYLYVPSTITPETFQKQQIKAKTFRYGENEVLAGSAEQGILEYFANSKVDEMKIYSKNTCFRTEDYYEGLKRVKEFTKVEQFIFCYEEKVDEMFEQLLNNAYTLLKEYDIKYRTIDVTSKDFGYHKKKFDIEVWTEKYGWMETHSCSYFGEEQSKRYNIAGAKHTLSNTGIAVPRVLIPLIEKNKKGQIQ
ncbi:Serine--tRNA ligase [compost metagenome]